MTLSTIRTQINSYDQKISDFLLIGFFLFLPLLPVLSIISLVVLAVFYVATSKRRNSFQFFKKDIGIKIFLAYYFLHIVGLAYSDNLSYGFHDLETKLSFLLFPIILSGIVFNKMSMEKIKTTFIVSTVLSLAVLLVLSVRDYYYTSDSHVFFYTQLSHGKHATYLAVYFNLALLFILQRLFAENSKVANYRYVPAFFFLFIGILLLSARTSTLVALITIALYPLFQFGSAFMRSKLFLLHLVLIASCILLFVGYLHVFNRFSQVEEAIETREHQHMTVTVPNEAPNSTNIRFNLWKNAIQLIGRHPFWGVGTGDIKEELVKIYTENNYEYGIKERISPHNQFLHTGVILGLAGISLLTLMIFYPFVLAWKQKEWLYVFFLLLILMNMMTESMLERQPGILFFAAFNMCFYMKFHSLKPKE